MRRLGLSDDRLLPPVIGGATRQGSVLAGLEALAPLRPDLVLIQDAARPLVDADADRRRASRRSSHDAALPVVPVTDTIKRSADGTTVVGDRGPPQLFAAQTPQGFRFAAILAAHRARRRDAAASSPTTRRSPNGPA